MNNIFTHSPDVLDPLLKGLQNCYALGMTESTAGYVPVDALIAKRAKNVKNQSSKPCTVSGQKPTGRASEKFEGSKRSASSSSEKSSTCGSNERKSRSEISHKPSPQEGEGAKLTYGNSTYDLLENTNRSTLKNTILDNRKSTMGGFCSGTVVVNTDPPTLHSTTSSNSGSRAKYLVNPKGSLDNTMVYGKIFEDAACRPREQSVLCGQCLAHHPVHTQEPCNIFLVTEDQELAHDYKSHQGGLRDSSFRDRLEAEGISHSQIIHIEFIDVRDGGAFADNLTWLSVLITGSSCRHSRR